MKRQVFQSLVKGQKPHVFITYDRTPLDYVRQIARERFAWPGGYELCAVTNEGELLCSACVRDEYKQIIHDTRHAWQGSGWCVDGITTEAVLEDASCSQCGKQLGYQTEEEN